MLTGKLTLKEAHNETEIMTTTTIAAITVITVTVITVLLGLVQSGQDSRGRTLMDMPFGVGHLG